MPSATAPSSTRSRRPRRTGRRAARGLAEAVARSLYKLMAYKDEYEVARLYTDGEFLKKLGAQFEGDYKLTFHLAPPLFADRDPATGRARRRRVRAWVMTVFRVLASLKRLRGTALDVFGYTEERRMERRLIAEYEATVETLLATLDQDNHALAVQIAGDARDDARLRPHQGEEREGRQGARSEPARRLPQPRRAGGRGRIASGTPAPPKGSGRKAKASRVRAPPPKGGSREALSRYRPCLPPPQLQSMVVFAHLTRPISAALSGDRHPLGQVVRDPGRPAAGSQIAGAGSPEPPPGQATPQARPV